MKPSSRLQGILILVLLAFGLASCSNPDENFIQGRWQRGNVHFVDEWFFDREAGTLKIGREVYTRVAP